MSYRNGQRINRRWAWCFSALSWLFDIVGLTTIALGIGKAGAMLLVSVDGKSPNAISDFFNQDNYGLWLDVATPLCQDSCPLNPI